MDFLPEKDHKKTKDEIKSLVRFASIPNNFALSNKTSFKVMQRVATGSVKYMREP